VSERAGGIETAGIAIAACCGPLVASLGSTIARSAERPRLLSRLINSAGIDALADEVEVGTEHVQAVRRALAEEFGTDDPSLEFGADDPSLVVFERPGAFYRRVAGDSAGLSGPRRAPLRPALSSIQD
jgi:hypothetical protein